MFRRITVPSALSVVLVLLAVGILSLGGASSKSVSPAEAMLVYGGDCMNISNYNDGCGGGICEYDGTLYTFSGACFNYVKNTPNCAGNSSCGQYHTLGTCSGG
jgi:hypothetical protein